jgi:hypothetical protein
LQRLDHRRNAPLQQLQPRAKPEAIERRAPIDRTEVALVASPDASPATLRLADRLAEFCETVQAKAA